MLPTTRHLLKRPEAHYSTQNNPVDMYCTVVKQTLSLPPRADATSVAGASPPWVTAKQGRNRLVVELRSGYCARLDPFHRSISNESVSVSEAFVAEYNSGHLNWLGTNKRLQIQNDCNGFECRQGSLKISHESYIASLNAWTDATRQSSKYRRRDHYQS